MTAKEDAKEKEEGDEEEEEAASKQSRKSRREGRKDGREGEEEQMKAKPQQLFNEFVPSTHSTVTFSLPPPALVQQPWPQQYYLQPYTQTYITPHS